MSSTYDAFHPGAADRRLAGHLSTLAWILIIMLAVPFVVLAGGVPVVLIVRAIAELSEALIAFLR